MKDQPKHTPGPWRWEVNEKGKSVQLCGGVPKYDRAVMDFVRWGMGGATPRFQDSSNHGLLTKCIKWANAVIGREHHAHWFKALDHPDARLIAAAPKMADEIEQLKQENAELLEALKALVALGSLELPHQRDAAINTALAVISKKEGRGE